MPADRWSLQGSVGWIHGRAFGVKGLTSGVGAGELGGEERQLERRRAEASTGESHFEEVADGKIFGLAGVGEDWELLMTAGNESCTD